MLVFCNVLSVFFSARMLFFVALLVCFFFKQKTAYELLRSLVGSEMCIRDSLEEARVGDLDERPEVGEGVPDRRGLGPRGHVQVCLLYTSDAADDLLCVDIGGRRIIKKKKHNRTT